MSTNLRVLLFMVFLLGVWETAMLPANARRLLPIHFSATTSPSTVHPGEVVTVTIRATVDPGWHVYSVVPTPNGPSATEILSPAGWQTDQADDGRRAGAQTGSQLRPSHWHSSRHGDVRQDVPRAGADTFSFDPSGPAGGSIYNPLPDMHRQDLSAADGCSSHHVPDHRRRPGSL